jgi:hypothetical protein
VEQGEEVRFGEEPAELEEDALAAAHSGQPVMDERDPHRVES